MRHFLEVLFVCFWLSISLLSGAALAVDDRYLAEIVALAEAGDNEAQLSLALFYEYGEQGVQRSQEKSLYWLKQAGDSCLPCACLYLGIKFESGAGVEQDLQKALHYYTCAARQDWPAAQFYLGRLYAMGKGVEKNPQQALAWFGLAVEHGYPGASEEYRKLANTLGAVDTDKVKDRQLQLLHDHAPCK